MRLSPGLNLGRVLLGGGTPAVPTAPGAVSNLAAARGNQQAVLTWSAPSSGGSPITDYVIEYKLASELTTWTTFSDGTSASAGATVTSLTNGSAYNFRVKAVNAVGTGNASNVANATPATTPAAPSLSLTPGDGQISIAWTDGSTGGSAITSHNLYRGTASGSLTLLGSIMSSSPYVDSTVTNGTTYYYKIAAVNDVGEGTLSTEQSATPDVAPTDVADLRYSTANSRWEVFNASAFPGATYVYKDEAGTTLATTTNAYLAGSTTDSGVTVEVQSQPATKSVVCFKAMAYLEDRTLDLTGVTDNTPLNTLGFQCDNNIVVQGGNVVALSKVTSLITRRIDGTTGAPGVSGSALNMEIEVVVDNNDLGGSGDGTNKSGRAILTDVSSSVNWAFAETRGNIASMYKRVGGDYQQLGTTVSAAQANGTTYKARIQHVGGTKYSTTRRKAPGGTFARYVPADTGPGIVVNGPGTALPNGNSVGTIGVNGDYNGSDYPLTLYRSYIRTRGWAPTAINVYEAVPVAPTIDNPVSIQMTGYSSLTGTHEACIIDQYGRQLSSFQTFTLTSSLFDFLLPGSDAILDLGTVDVLLRKVGTPNSAVVHSGVIVPAWRPINRDLLLGFNTGSIGSSSPLIFADITYKMRWYYETAAGGTLNVYPELGTTYPVEMAPNGKPTGFITNAAWAAGGRRIVGVLIEGDGTSSGTLAVTKAGGGDVMPYGTAGQWTFAYAGDKTDFSHLTPFRGALSPFSNFAFDGANFTCDVTEKGNAGNVTTFIKMVPNAAHAGGQGISRPNGMPISFRKTGDTSGNLLLPSVISAYGRERIIRPMQEHMGNQAEFNRGVPTVYPFSNSPWSDMDNMLQLVQSFGPQACGWMCIPPGRIETSPGSNTDDPYASYRRMFEKLAIDRAKLKATTSYTNPFYFEFGNELWNDAAAPYAGWNWPFISIGNAMGFFTGMSAGGVKNKYQRHAAAAWLANAAAKFLNDDIIPDMTAMGFPSLADLSNPAHKLNGQARLVYGIQGNSQAWFSTSEIQAFFAEAGEVSHIYGIAPSSYFYCNKTTALKNALDANDLVLAESIMASNLTADANNLIATIKAKSLEYNIAFPWLKMLTYEGRWHNDGNLDNSTQTNRYIQVWRSFRQTDTYKNIEKSVLVAMIEAGYDGVCDFVAYEGFAELVGGTYFQNFGIMSDAGQYTDPATSSAQKAQIARDEVHDLIEAWAT